LHRAFLPANGTVANANKLDGREAAAFQPRLLWAEVNDDGTILRGHGAVAVQ
jgi:hypothetical protein